jgi:hypothetical protein
MQELSRRSVLLTALVESASRRRDVRELRAQIVLLLLSLRCPLSGAPLKPWYVPGAVARLGAEGLLRAWRGYFGEDPPCLRSMRSHLGALEQAGILQRGPGDWLPMRRDPAHPERRPRWPDTFHVLDGEAASEFWSGPGARLLELYPAARHSPDLWRKLFSGWRSGARQHVLALEGLLGSPESPPRAAANPEDLAASKARGVALGRELVRARSPLAVLEALGRAGANLKGAASFRAAGQWRRAQACGGLLARALARGDRIRNPAGWIWRALEDATAQDLAVGARWLGMEPHELLELGR